MTEQTVLDRLMEAFPSEYSGETSTDHVFRFAPTKAMIWVRKSNLNIARIEITHMSNYLSNFPNKDELRKVIDNPAFGVQRHKTQTKDERLFGPHNVDRLIEALKGVR